LKYLLMNFMNYSLYCISSELSILLRLFIFTIWIVLFIIVWETYLLALYTLFDRLLDFKQMDTWSIRCTCYHIKGRVEDYRGNEGFARTASQFLKQVSFFGRKDTNNGTFSRCARYQCTLRIYC
jgi:hypothetical protein